MISCKKCDGKGTILKTSRIPLMGSFQMRTACPTCKGEGEVPEKPCSKCKGEGEIQVRKRLHVTIPKNIRVDEILVDGERSLKGDIDMQFKVKLPDVE